MRYSSSQYAKSLYDLLETKKPSEYKKFISDFVHTLIRHNRLNLIRSIVMDFEKLWYEKKDVTKVQVETTGNQAKNMEDLLKHALGGKTEITEKILPELIGGARITVGDTRIDDTVRRRMNDLNNAIAK